MRANWTQGGLEGEGRGKWEGAVGDEELKRG